MGSVVQSDVSFTFEGLARILARQPPLYWRRSIAKLVGLRECAATPAGPAILPNRKWDVGLQSRACVTLTALLPEQHFAEFSGFVASC